MMKTGMRSARFASSSGYAACLRLTDSAVGIGQRSAAKKNSTFC
ncbi:hypothetical protein [Klebsiella phage vB_KshKPC-M]|nr:hypothetical protein [Klebsiella phage vB_KshKPC-M]